MEFPRLNAIVDADVASRAGWPLLELAGAILEGGARFLQLRAKQMSGAELLETAAQIVALARPHDAIVIVNDRADIAALSGASGVHLGQDDLAPRAARRIVGDRATIGRSTHNEAQIDAALREPVDYIAVGPVFDTMTKATGYQAVGLDLVRYAARAQRPVVAIGGITLERAPAAIAAGAQSVAVVSDLLTGGDPRARVRAFVDRLARADAAQAD